MSTILSDTYRIRVSQYTQRGMQQPFYCSRCKRQPRPVCIFQFRSHPQLLLTFTKNPHRSPQSEFLHLLLQPLESIPDESTSALRSRFGCLVGSKPLQALDISSVCLTFYAYSSLSFPLLFFHFPSRFCSFVSILLFDSRLKSVFLVVSTLPSCPSIHRTKYTGQIVGKHLSSGNKSVMDFVSYIRIVCIISFVLLLYVYILYVYMYVLTRIGDAQ